MEQAYTLPCGARVPNRLAKAALSECLADPATNDANAALCALYRRWSLGQPGMLVTGNVMVSRTYLENPTNVVFDGQTDLAAARAWAAAAKAWAPTVALVQISHPGRQCPMSVTTHAVAPSAVAFRIPRLRIPLTLVPRELTEVSAEIEGIIAQYAAAARIAVAAGFDGVQIHGAHGYLCSQFLSPLSNRRRDRWGGSLENRCRFLLAVIDAVRTAVGPDRVVGLKLNSADFQRGGFDEEESEAVVVRLNATGIDFLEVSGGTYENPAMMTHHQTLAAQRPPSDRTRLREGYFLAFAERVRRLSDKPLMVTGGFRSAAGVAVALSSGAIDFVGLGRIAAVDPDCPRKLLKDPTASYDVRLDRLSFHGVLDEVVVPLLSNLWYVRQLHRLAQGLDFDAEEGRLGLLTVTLFRQYFFEPRRHPAIAAATRALALALVALAAAAAFLWR